VHYKLSQLESVQVVLDAIMCIIAHYFANATISPQSCPASMAEYGHSRSKA